MNTLYRVTRHFVLLSVILCFYSIAFSQVIPDSLVRKKVRDIHNPLERLLTLEPQIYQYNVAAWKDIRLPNGHHYGFFPENVELAFPELVSYQNHSYIAGKNLFRTAKIKTVDTESLIPVLVASIKEMQGEVEKMKRELELLKKETSLLD